MRHCCSPGPDRICRSLHNELSAGAPLAGHKLHRWSARRTVGLPMRDWPDCYPLSPTGVERNHAPAAVLAVIASCAAVLLSASNSAAGKAPNSSWVACSHIRGHSFAAAADVVAAAGRVAAAGDVVVVGRAAAAAAGGDGTAAGANEGADAVQRDDSAWDSRWV